MPVYTGGKEKKEKSISGKNSSDQFRTRLMLGALSILSAISSQIRSP